MLTDVEEQLGETIPDFHNMELRLRQLSEAVAQDAAGRVKEVGRELDLIREHANEMCRAEVLYREGRLPKRICHCDTKVNNMLRHPLNESIAIITFMLQKYEKTTE